MKRYLDSAERSCDGVFRFDPHAGEIKVAAAAVLGWNLFVSCGVEEMDGETNLSRIAEFGCYDVVLRGRLRFKTFAETRSDFRDRFTYLEGPSFTFLMFEVDSAKIIGKTPLLKRVLLLL